MTTDSPTVEGDNIWDQIASTLHRDPLTDSNRDSGTRWVSRDRIRIEVDCTPDEARNILAVACGLNVETMNPCGVPSGYHDDGDPMVCQRELGHEGSHRHDTCGEWDGDHGALNEPEPISATITEARLRDALTSLADVVDAAAGDDGVTDGAVLDAAVEAVEALRRITGEGE